MSFIATGRRAMRCVRISAVSIPTSWRRAIDGSGEGELAMDLTRRAWIAAASTIPLQAKLAPAADSTPAADITLALPAKAQFPTMPLTYLDSGTMHPISLGARNAIDLYYKGRAHDPAAPAFTLDGTDKSIRAKFAGLINATPEEICLVQ